MDKYRRNSIEDRGHTERPRYHAHTRWTQLLPLDSPAPRRTPRRASEQLTTSQNKNVQLRKSVNPNPWPWPTKLTFDPAWTAVKLKGQKIDWKQTDGRTDGQTLAIALPSRLTRKMCLLLCAVFWCSVTQWRRLWSINIYDSFSHVSLLHIRSPTGTMLATAAQHQACHRGLYLAAFRYILLSIFFSSLTKLTLFNILPESCHGRRQKLQTISWYRTLISV